MIFEQSYLGTIKLQNRIFRSATHEGLADENGYPTEKLITKYETLAKNEVGCIITGFAGIMQNGKTNNHNMLMIDNDSFIDSYSKLTKKVHKYNTPIILQIAHCGRQTRSKRTGFPIVAPSPVKDKTYKEETAKELTEPEIFEIIDNFVSGIIRAKSAGFDGVQLHLAHGHLLAQFLSSYTNRRKDKWGGSLENKFRIVKEIFDRAKLIVGDFPILVKLNAYDGRKNGMRINEAVKIAKMLEFVGCSGIEVSCGVYEDGLFTIRGAKLPIKAVFKYSFAYKRLPDFIKWIANSIVPAITPKIKPYDNYNVEYANEIKKNVDIAVIVVGGIKKRDSIETIINEKKADYVSMSRPLIAEPNLVKKFKNGIQRESKCIDCNYCMIASEEETLKCYRGRLN
jgi:2,4-dienoyl-CoA reductase-like NADH-dependent reductase (Old Yellow Enzyme family)